MFKRALSIGLLLALGVMVHAQKPVAPKTTLKVGDAAPDFTLRATDGKTLQAQRLQRQEERRAGDLCAGIHRWLNEGNEGVSG